jgi:uncharacterized protein (DUF1501 family)
VTHEELRNTLSTFAAERLALLQRHEAGARAVSHYDFNNTYQYVIAREETHLTWLRNALAEFGAGMPSAAAALPMPAAPTSKRPDASAFKAILEDDVRHLREFVARWRERLKDFSHARHLRVLEVILGESLEYERLFKQAAAGFEDVLGRRTGGVPRVGGVLSTRWVE